MCNLFENVLGFFFFFNLKLKWEYPERFSESFLLIKIVLSVAPRNWKRLYKLCCPSVRVCVCPSVCPIHVSYRPCVSIKWLSSIVHERIVKNWWHSHTWLISIKCWSWTKAKITRSKIKEKYAILKKNCFDCKSWINNWILITLAHMIIIDKMLTFTLVQGRKVKGQGQICKFIKKKLV